MASRAPRRGGCPAGGGPRLTRTQMLRQAKTAAIVQKEPRERPEDSAATGRKACPPKGSARGPRTGLAKVAPPPREPKKLDFARPGMTKAMQLRQKLSMEKIRQEEEAQRKREACKRRPQRTPAPVGGDARAGREKVPPVRKTPGLRAVQQAVSAGHVVTRRGGEIDQCEMAVDDAIARGHIVTDRRGARPKKPKVTPGGPGTRRRGPLATATPIPEVTKELAISMDADVLHAVPMSDGPVDKIIIGPGTINEDRNTIVCISPPALETVPEEGTLGTSQIANRSIQVISETLDVQDAAESAAVQEKLEELQQARRDFVMTIANVGGNTINMVDDADDSILDLDGDLDALEYIPTPPRRRQVIQLPDVSHEMFRIDYGLDHPDVQAAREFSKRAQVNIDQRAAERRMEEEFATLARREIDDMRLDVPFAQDIMEGDISFEEDDEGVILPCPSRIKASMPKIPKRTEAACPVPPITVEQLERFFNVEKYPPPPKCPGPPPGREALHPDLWEIDDPWYHEPEQPDVSDLMRFDDSY